MAVEHVYSFTSGYNTSTFTLDDKVISSADLALIESKKSAGELKEADLVQILAKYPDGWTKTESGPEAPSGGGGNISDFKIEDIEGGLELYLTDVMRLLNHVRMDQQSGAREAGFVWRNQAWKSAQDAFDKGMKAAEKAFVAEILGAVGTIGGAVVQGVGARDSLRGISNSRGLNKQLDAKIDAKSKNKADFDKHETNLESSIESRKTQLKEVDDKLAEETKSVDDLKEAVQKAQRNVAKREQDVKNMPEYVRQKTEQKKAVDEKLAKVQHDRRAAEAELAEAQKSGDTNKINTAQNKVNDLQAEEKGLQTESDTRAKELANLKSQDELEKDLTKSADDLKVGTDELNAKTKNLKDLEAKGKEAAAGIEQDQKNLVKATKTNEAEQSKFHTEIESMRAKVTEAHQLIQATGMVYQALGGLVTGAYNGGSGVMRQDSEKTNKQAEFDKAQQQYEQQISEGMLQVADQTANMVNDGLNEIDQAQRNSNSTFSQVAHAIAAH